MRVVGIVRLMGVRECRCIWIVRRWMFCTCLGAIIVALIVALIVAFHVAFRVAILAAILTAIW